MPKRRPKGTGSIKVLPDGRADAQYITKAWDGSPRRLYKRLPSEAAAERWLLKVRHEEAEGALPAAGSDGLTVAAYLRAWLEESVSGTVARHTERDYRDKVRLHIVPHIGAAKLQDLTSRDLNRLYRRIADKRDGRGGVRTARYVHAIMHRALHEAEGADLVRKNVARWAKPPKEGHLEQPVMGVDEAGRFLDVIRGDRLEALYLLAVTTGLRRGELLGIKWKDLDLEAGTLKVSRSLDTYYGPPTDNDPKRSASRRPAVLPGPVVDALKRRKAAHAAEKLAAGKNWRERGYVFPTRLGTPMRGDNLLSRGLKPMMEKAGLAKLAYDFRALRRSNATFLVMLGVNLRVAQRMMGHGSVHTTAKYYAQVPDELQAKAAALVGDLLLKPPETGE